jgi:hypothetical protein
MYTNSSTQVDQNEDRVIGETGLYSPQPIPAQIVLANAKQFSAQRLLLALSSYLGDKSSRVVFPSYIQLNKRCGLSSGTISKALQVLIEYEFIKIFQYWEKGRKRNRYYFQDSCYHSYKMNKLARSYLPDIGVCACGSAVKSREIVFGNSDYHHFKCGAVVRILPDSTNYQKKLSNLRAQALRAARDADSLLEE